MSEAFRRTVFSLQKVARHDRACPRPPAVVRQRSSNHVASKLPVPECAPGDIQLESDYLTFRHWQEACIPAPSIRLGREHATFEDLLKAREDLVAAGTLSSDVMASDKTALNRFRECFGLSEKDSLAPSLTSEFPANLRVFRATALGPGIAGKRISERSIPSYMSRLRKFHASALAMLATSETFTEAYNRLLATWLSDVPGRSFMDLSRESGVAESAIRSWKRGNRPLEKSLPSIRRLESALGCHPGGLETKIFDRESLGSQAHDNRVLARLNDDSHRPHFNRVLYYPKFELLPGILQRMFEKIEEFKTGRAAKGFAGQQLRRASRAKARKGKLSRWSVNFRQFMNGMLGWLTLPVSLEGAREYVIQNTRGQRLTPAQADLLAPLFMGMGLSLQDLTPCHLVEPELVGKYMDWKTSRSNDIESGYHRSFMMNVMALTRAEVGFLTQQPDYAWGYLDEVPVDKSEPGWRSKYDASAKSWAARCADIHDGLRQIASELSKHAKFRDPRIELGPILNDKDPMRPLIEIIREHELLRPTPSVHAVDNRQHSLALWRRDQLLLRLIVSNPLRCRNFTEMAWREGEEVNLYRTDQGWRIKFAAKDFKNEDGAARHPYNVEVAPSLTALIDTYMTQARPVLLRGKKTDAVFVTTTGTQFGEGGPSEVLVKLSRRYLRENYPTVTALRAHAFRHIVATAWLRSHPDQFRAVAMILHDTLDTVLKNYDHTRPEEGLALWNEWLSDRLPPPRV